MSDMTSDDAQFEIVIIKTLVGIKTSPIFFFSPGKIYAHEPPQANTA